MSEPVLPLKYVEVVVDGVAAVGRARRLQDLAGDGRSNASAWMRTASGPRSAEGCARHGRRRKSPVRTATELPQRWLALGTPRRTSASSITSSWYSVARWVSSTTTAEGTMPGAYGSPNCAASVTKAA